MLYIIHKHSRHKYTEKQILRNVLIGKIDLYKEWCYQKRTVLIFTYIALPRKAILILVFIHGLSDINVM